MIEFGSKIFVRIDLLLYTYCCVLIEQLSFFKEECLQSVVSDRHYLVAHVPEDIKLAGQSRIVCREAASNQSSTHVAAQRRSLLGTAGTEVELNKSPHTITKKSKL